MQAPSSDTNENHLFSAMPARLWHHMLLTPCGFSIVYSTVAEIENGCRSAPLSTGSIPKFTGFFPEQYFITRKDFMKIDWVMFA